MADKVEAIMHLPEIWASDQRCPGMIHSRSFLSELQWGKYSLSRLLTLGGGLEIFRLPIKEIKGVGAQTSLPHLSRWSPKGSPSPLCPKPARHAKLQAGYVAAGVSAPGATHPR